MNLALYLLNITNSFMQQQQIIIKLISMLIKLNECELGYKMLIAHKKSEIESFFVKAMQVSGRARLTPPATIDHMNQCNVR
jgi:hypothetical protein